VHVNAGIAALVAAMVIGRQKGVTEVYRGAKEVGNLMRKIRLEIAVNDNCFLEPAVSAIIKGAKTGELGDGKIFVMVLAECIHIRTEERCSIVIYSTQKSDRQYAVTRLRRVGLTITTETWKVKFRFADSSID